MLDSLLFDLKSVCEQLLPILGAVALVYLCILLKHAWKLLDQAVETVRSLDPTIKLANQSIEKVQAPLDTAVKLSHTMDDMHDKAVEGVSRLAESAAGGVDKMKSFVADKTGRKDDIAEAVAEADKEEASHE